MASVKGDHGKTHVVSGQAAALFSGALAFAGVAISAANIWIAYISKSNDLDIATRKDLREFISKYRDVIYGNDRNAAEQIRNVMLATFPAELVKTALTRIEIDVPRATRDLFSVNLIPGSNVISGKVSTFGGPNDPSIGPSEGLSLISEADLPNFSGYFLPQQPSGTTGLGRRLNPSSFYIMARWNYQVTPKEFLKTHRVIVRNILTGKSAEAQPVDWGPNAFTGRVADLSPGLAREIGVQTDDEVTIEIPPGVPAKP